jgi:hypothetical protein
MSTTTELAQRTGGTTGKTNAIDRKTGLSTLWIFLMFNFVYADIVALFDLVFNGKGALGSTQFTQGLLLGFSVELEIPMVMIILSRVLNYRINRLANIIAGGFFTAITLITQFIVPIMNGTTTLYYLFFGVVEIATTLFIIWYAWKWPKQPPLMSR